MTKQTMLTWLLALLLAGCGAGSTPLPPADQAELVPLERVTSGDYDGQVVTVLAVYYERGPNRLLVPALSLAALEGPVPLLGSLQEALRLDAAPQGSLVEERGARYAAVRVQGRVAADEQGRRMAVSQAKVLVPPAVALGSLRGSGFDGAVVSVEGTLLSRPGALLLVGAVGPGGVPELDAPQVKLLSSRVDEQLLASLRAGPGSEVRYGPVQVVGLWSSGALHLLWARPG